MQVISNEKFRDESEKSLEITDMTATDLQNSVIGPFVFEVCREQVTKRISNDKYRDILAVYNRSLFRDFESLRTEVDLSEDAIRLVSDEYNSSFIPYESEPCFYNFENFSQALLKIL